MAASPHPLAGGCIHPLRLNPSVEGRGRPLFDHEPRSYTRDLALAGWCRDQGVQWTEMPQTGVVRRLRSRAGWASQWAQRMNAHEAPLVAGFNAAPDQPPDRMPTLGDLGVHALSAALPAAGERAAWSTLESFLAGRGRDYRWAMSSPLRAAEGCSRLSAHLAFGTISVRCVHQATEASIAATTDRELAYALRGFASQARAQPRSPGAAHPPVGAGDRDRGVPKTHRQ